MSEVEERERADRVLLRHKTLSKTAVTWINTLNDKFGVELSYTPSVVYLIAQSALQDIDRYKDHHQTIDEKDDKSDPKRKLSDEVKRAGYFLKWIQKLQPLHVVTKKEHLEGTTDFGQAHIANMANMGFAITYAMNALCDDPQAVDRIDLTNEFFNELLYVLTYRELSSDGLLLAMHMMRAYSRGISLVRE